MFNFIIFCGVVIGLSVFDKDECIYTVPCPNKNNFKWFIMINVMFGVAHLTILTSYRLY